MESFSFFKYSFFLACEIELIIKFAKIVIRGKRIGNVRVVCFIGISEMLKSVSMPCKIEINPVLLKQRKEHWKHKWSIDMVTSRWENREVNSNAYPFYFVSLESFKLLLHPLVLL